MNKFYLFALLLALPHSAFAARSIGCDGLFSGKLLPNGIAITQVHLEFHEITGETKKVLLTLKSAETTNGVSIIASYTQDTKTQISHITADAGKEGLLNISLTPATGHGLAANENFALASIKQTLGKKSYTADGIVKCKLSEN